MLLEKWTGRNIITFYTGKQKNSVEHVERCIQLKMYHLVSENLGKNGLHALRLTEIVQETILENG